MISEQQVSCALRTVLGSADRINREKLTAKLNKAAQDAEIELSAFGYLTHMLYSKGASAALNTTLLSDANILTYVTRAQAERDSIGRLLLNALTYMESMVEKCGSLQSAIPVIERMTEPHILYLLLAGQFRSYAKKYEEQARIYFDRYPGSAEKLPEQFQEYIARLNDDSPVEGGACAAPHPEL